MNQLNVRLVEPESYDSVFSLAHKYGLTVFDAAYLEVAIQEHLPLASLDRRLVKAAAAAGVEVFRM